MPSRRPVYISLMGAIYRLTPAAWRRYATARVNGCYPKPGRGWTLVCEDPIDVTDMEDADFAEVTDAQDAS